MSNTAITVTLDRERLADVRPHLIELERVTGTGVGQLLRRVIAGDFHASDLSETVRLALIGGGASPAEAATLARVYIAERPLTEGHGLATEILLAAWNGTKPAPAAVEPPSDYDAGEVILDDTSPNPMRVENDGSLTPVGAAIFEARRQQRAAIENADRARRDAVNAAWFADNGAE